MFSALGFGLQATALDYKFLPRTSTALVLITNNTGTINTSMVIPRRCVIKVGGFGAPGSSGEQCCKPTS